LHQANIDIVAGVSEQSQGFIPWRRQKRLPCHVDRMRVKATFDVAYREQKLTGDPVAAAARKKHIGRKSPALNGKQDQKQQDQSDIHQPILCQAFPKEAQKMEPNIGRLRTISKTMEGNRS
jgi:hypothetical protein